MLQFYEPCASQQSKQIQKLIFSKIHVYQLILRTLFTLLLIEEAVSALQAVDPEKKTR